MEHISSLARQAGFGKCFSYRKLPCRFNFLTYFHEAPAFLLLNSSGHQRMLLVSRFQWVWNPWRRLKASATAHLLELGASYPLVWSGLRKSGTIPAMMISQWLILSWVIINVFEPKCLEQNVLQSITMSCPCDWATGNIVKTGLFQIYKNDTFCTRMWQGKLLFSEVFNIKLGCLLIADNIAQCFGELPEFSQAAIQLRWSEAVWLNKLKVSCLLKKYCRVPSCFRYCGESMVKCV